MKLIRLIK